MPSKFLKRAWVDIHLNSGLMILKKKKQELENFQDNFTGYR